MIYSGTSGILPIIQGLPMLTRSNTIVKCNNISAYNNILYISITNSQGLSNFYIKPYLKNCPFFNNANFAQNMKIKLS